MLFRRLVDGLCVPKTCMDKGKPVKSLHFYIPRITIYWLVHKKQVPKANSLAFLLRINGECLDALEKAIYRL